MIEIEQIETLITVIESNGFAAAAKKLKISTAAVSRQISRLESSLGAKLLNRTPRKVTLTTILSFR